MHRLIRWMLPACVAAIASASTTYDIVAGFSYSSNPNGVWTYLQDGTAYTTSQGSSDQIAGLPGWDNGGGFGTNVYMLQNTTGSTVTDGTINDPNDTLWLDPQSESVAVVFTAPSAGSYTIAGEFLAIDTGENEPVVEILDNGVSVFSEVMGAYGTDQSFDFMETLNAGDTITFEVLEGANGFFDQSTGLEGTITLNPSGVPEPSTWLLTAAGLAALGWRRLRT